MSQDEGRLDPTQPTSQPPATGPDATAAAQPAKPTSGLRELIETLLLAALIFFVVRLLVLNFRVDGESMTPNLQNDEYLLVNVNSYRHFDLNGVANLLPGEDSTAPNEVWPFGGPKRGDIIVLNPTPDAAQPYIKRIIGLPGEHVTFHQGYVYINGVQLNEEYIEPGITRCREGQYCDVQVEPDHVFVLGDNRTNSTDSRYIGQIPIDQVIGKAWVSYWPLNLFGFVPHYEYGQLPAADTTLLPSTPATQSADDPAATDEETREERQARRQAERATREAGNPDATVTIGIAASPTPTP